MENHIKKLRGYDPEKKEKIIIGVTSVFAVSLLIIMVLLTGHRINSFKKNTSNSEASVIKGFSEGLKDELKVVN